jgi:hypothetical protein
MQDQDQVKISFACASGRHLACKGLVVSLGYLGPCRCPECEHSPERDAFAA